MAAIEVSDGLRRRLEAAASEGMSVEDILDQASSQWLKAEDEVDAALAAGSLMRMLDGM